MRPAVFELENVRDKFPSFCAGALGGEVFESDDYIADERTEGWLVLEAHCRDSDRVMQTANGEAPF